MMQIVKKKVRKRFLFRSIVKYINNWNKNINISNSKIILRLNKTYKFNALHSCSIIANQTRNEKKNHHFIKNPANHHRRPLSVPPVTHGFAQPFTKTTIADLDPHPYNPSLFSLGSLPRSPFERRLEGRGGAIKRQRIMRAFDPPKPDQTQGIYVCVSQPGIVPLVLFERLRVVARD